MAGTVLVVEDDAAIRRGVVDALGFAGYRVVQAETAPKGLAAAFEHDLDLVLLDVLLPGPPGVTGFDVLAQIRSAKPTLPVIMVTARGSEDDRVRGLVNGADDYVVKPFSARELLARVEAVLRRSPERRTDVKCIHVEGRTIHLERMEIRFVEDGRLDEPARTLTEREAAILRYLAVCRGRPVDRDELLHRVWGLDPKGLHTRTVDMTIARLREKLEDSGEEPKIIRTLRNKGYMLSESAQIME